MNTETTPTTPITSPHVRVKGYDHDRRTYRSVWGKTKSDGRTMCGAPSTPDDLGRAAGEGSLQLAKWRVELCPNCVAALEQAQK